jgi:UTP--glucose-1-phosphate uridylyltransferase
VLARARDLGHALLCAKELVAGDPFAMLLADDVMLGQTPIIQQMVAQFEHSQQHLGGAGSAPRAHQTLWHCEWLCSGAGRG